MTAQSSYPRTGTRPGAATSGDHWHDNDTLQRGAQTRNASALDIIVKLDALRDHVADLARAPQPLPPPVAEEAERRLVSVVLCGAACRWEQALEASCFILLSPVVDAAAHPTWALALRSARRIYSRRCRWTVNAIVEDAWHVEQATGPWFADDLRELDAEAVNVCTVNADVEAVIRAQRLRLWLDAAERLCAACRTHNEETALEYVALIGELGRVGHHA